MLATGPGLVAQDDRRPIDGHWACETILADNTMYVAGVWDDNEWRAEVNTAWLQYLMTKYQFKGQGACSVAYMSGSTLAKIQGDVKNRYAQLRKQGVKVIETGWTFVPDKVSLPYYCMGAVVVWDNGQKQGFFYLTKVLGMPANTGDKLYASWLKYAKDLHPGLYWEPAPGCSLLPADPAQQQAAFDEWAKQYTARKYEIVHVDWSYTGPPVATAADTLKGYYCQYLSVKLLYITGVNLLEDPEESYDWVAYRAAWQTYARNTLKIDPDRFLGGCDTGRMPIAKEARAARVAQVKGQAGGEVHEVDWKYTKGQTPAPAPAAATAPAAAASPPPTSPQPAPSGQSAAQPAPPASAPPKPQEVPYLCQWIYHTGSGQGQMTYYLTEVFSSATPQLTLNQAWQKHLADTYHPANQAQGRCHALGSRRIRKGSRP